MCTIFVQPLFRDLVCIPNHQSLLATLSQFKNPIAIYDRKAKAIIHASKFTRKKNYFKSKYSRRYSHQSSESFSLENFQTTGLQSSNRVYNDLDEKSKDNRGKSNGKLFSNISNLYAKKKKKKSETPIITLKYLKTLQLNKNVSK